MDIISAYREVGSYRGAAAICETTPKTVRRVIERHESGGAPQRAPRPRNYDAVTQVVIDKIAETRGRMSAKRLLPLAVAAGRLRRLRTQLPSAGRRGQGPVASHPSPRAAPGGLDPGGAPGHRLGFSSSFIVSFSFFLPFFLSFFLSFFLGDKHCLVKIKI